MSLSPSAAHADRLERLAHDVAGPLLALVGFASLIGDSPDEATRRKARDIIGPCVDDLSARIELLLAEARASRHACACRLETEPDHSF